MFKQKIHPLGQTKIVKTFVWFPKTFLFEEKETFVWLDYVEIHYKCYKQVGHPPAWVKTKVVYNGEQIQ